MTVRAVHWDEGMFLRPHHFQAAQRYWVHLTQQTAKWDTYYNWGLRAIDIDTPALGDYQFIVRGLHARLRDGTQVSVPEEGALPPLDLRPLLARQPELTISLAVPVVQEGRANVSTEGVVADRRFRVESAQLDDENIGRNARPVKMRSINLRLSTDLDSPAGQELLPIARVVKSAQVNAVPQLDVEYFPPMIDCEAWTPLVKEITSAVHYRVGQIMKQAATRVRSSNISFDTNTQGDRRVFELLRVLNEAYAHQGAHFFAQGVHPFEAYGELCRFVGQLAIFGNRREAPDLPRYDHDNLGPCFYAVKRWIDEYLTEVDMPTMPERPFIGAGGTRMQVTLEPDWLLPHWSMYVGVDTPLPATEILKLLTSSNHATGLDMKLGSSDRVDEIFRSASRGLLFAHATSPPGVLRKGLTYLQVNRNAQPLEWQNVQRSHNLAVRLNERLIDGELDKQETVKIRQPDKSTVPLRLTLFLVPNTLG